MVPVSTKTGIDASISAKATGRPTIRKMHEQHAAMASNIISPIPPPKLDQLHRHRAQQQQQARCPRHRWRGSMDPFICVAPSSRGCISTARCARRRPAGRPAARSSPARLNDCEDQMPNAFGDSASSRMARPKWRFCCMARSAARACKATTNSSWAISIDQMIGLPALPAPPRRRPPGPRSPPEAPTAHAQTSTCLRPVHRPVPEAGVGELAVRS